MARERTGSVSSFTDERGRRRFKVGLTPPPPLKGPQKWWRLDPGTTEARARATADAWNAESAINPAKFFPELMAGTPGETVEKYAKRWLDERDTRGLTSVGDDRQRMRDHVVPELGTLPMGTVAKEDVKRLVRALDDKVRAGKLSWKTAVHVWTLARTMFKDACSSKRTELVVREDDPTDKVAGPDRGEELSRTYLHPSEFQKLITCKDVPVEWRRLYALAAYTLSRAGELAALRWDAVDFERGVIHFRQATDRRKAGTLKGTKTQKNRRIPIEPTLRLLLEALFHDAKSAYVVHVPVSKRADVLREHLEQAGLKRAELFPPPSDGSVAATWAPLTFHDLRGTGVTWMALRGDEPLVIQQRAGHANFTTTQRYLREAETLGKDGGEPFPPLPEELCQSLLQSRRSSVSVQKDGAGHGVRTRSDEQQSSEPSETAGDEPRGNSDGVERKCAVSGRRRDSDHDSTGAPSAADHVEAALAEAIRKEAGRSEARADVLLALTRELEARRLARAASNVVPLARKGREGGRR